MEIKELVDIKDYTTFRMGPSVRYFCAVKTTDELKEGFSFAKARNLPVFILGSGSNIVMGQQDVFEVVVLKMELPGFKVIEENDSKVLIKIGAGENWDGVVKRAVEMNLWGIEAMSWIPGTAGATPIQNVGAYGREIADTLVCLEGYEIATGKTLIFTNHECKFSYRDSVFKNELKDKFVITSITLELSKRPGQVPDYPGVKKYFEERGIASPSLAEIRQAIIDIRNIKLPDPKEIASVGSFFKNPIVTAEHYEKLKEKHPNIVAFPLERGEYNIGAGWMLETLGLKGKQFGNLKFYENNALVVVNRGVATFKELQTLVAQTKTKAKEAFEIGLEMEPMLFT
mgnify:CR=1 FL=1